MKVCIVGSSGYTGIELIRGLLNHQEAQISQIVSRQYEGKTLSEVFPHLKNSRYADLQFSPEVDTESHDYYFLCLPHQPSLELAKKLIDKGKKVIDLSAAYRIKDTKVYPKYYKFEHSYPELLQQAVYGLPEVFREDIKKADLVANPGCYPTATILALYPAVKEGLVKGGKAVVNALSGISGAGRSVKQQFHYPEAFGNAYPYSPTGHRHIPEMEDVIKRASNRELKVRFTPHILPVSRGMISTVVFDTDYTKKDLIQLYKDYYKDEYFVRLTENPPQIKNVVGSNFCDIYIDFDSRTGQGIVISAIDNLGKGASLQAIQNFNLMLGIQEDSYIKEVSLLGILFP
ncbi:MAG: N-acetyl-gamma-glutamyl-phosphate reductase [Aquificae bacterium]|nr:N-acetyl-gamma-glutamyl-phosphate reductase [Aquificota bacterium]